MYNTEAKTKTRKWIDPTGNTPSISNPTNIRYSINNNTRMNLFPTTCKQYGEKWIYPDLSDPVNVSRIPTDYSHTLLECLNKPGIHAWIMFADGSFGAARTLSTYEVLSKHHNLYTYFGKREVVAAGEVMVGNDKSVVYNFQSGTFMVPIAEMFEERYGLNGEKKYEDVYAPWMTQNWYLGGASAVELQNDTLIRNNTLPFEEELLKKYSNAGVTFRSFPSQKECQAHARYFSQVGKAKRKATRNAYNAHAASMARYKRPILPFHEWLKEQKREEIFVEPNAGVTLFRGEGGRRHRKTRKNRFHH